MSNLRYTWRGKELESLWHLAALTALTAITRRLRDLCRLAVDDPYPPASRPGEPPHKRTGQGQAGIVAQTYPDLTSAALVVRTRYMLYLELGTSRILPRPWLRPTILRHYRELETLGHSEFARVMRRS